MMNEKIEHTEHRRPASAPGAPVAWSGPATATTPPARPAGRDRA